VHYLEERRMNGNTKRIIAGVCVAIMIVASVGAAVQFWRGQVNAVASYVGYPGIVDVNSPVSFTGSGSTGASLEYEWFFRDGAVNPTAANPTHTFTSEGIFDVGLVVTDSAGISDLTTVRVIVRNLFPIAEAGNSKSSCEDAAIVFDGRGSTDPNNDIINYLWDFGDGATSNQALTSHAYSKMGNYIATLTVTDNDGTIGVDTVPVTIYDFPPYANAGPDRTVNEDDIVYFDASYSNDSISDKDSLTYFWDFGDGTTGNGISTAHVYAEKGVFNIQLKVTDDDGQYDIDNVVITVNNVVPTAIAGPDQIVREGQTVIFDGTNTADTPTDRTVLNYSWSFGGKGTRPTYVWPDDGGKGVTLSVTDNDAASSTDTMEAAVQNVAPSVGINGLAVADSTFVNFTLRSAGEKWRDVHLYLHEDNILIRELEVNRMPGDPDDQTDTAYNVLLRFGKTYNVSVFFTPADDPVNGQPQGDSPAWIILGLEDGREFKIPNNFNVNQPETYRWDVDFSSVVKLTPRAAAFDPGSDNVTLYWNFGDTQSSIISHNYPNNGQYPMYVNDSVVHVYVWPGTYTVTLTAIDDDNGSSSHTVQLVNEPSSVSIDNYAPIASAGCNKIANEDDIVSFSGAATDDSADVLSYLWDFGDNSFASGKDATHVYSFAGTYLVILTVTDNHGAVDQDALFVTIGNIVPVAEAGIDRTISEDDTATFNGCQSIDTVSDRPLLTYHWDFGDGTFGNGISTSHVYTKIGTYAVTLIVTDNDGARDNDNLIVHVSNIAPTANAGTDQTVNEDQVVFFAGIGIDTPTDQQILSYSWNFGDGHSAYGWNPTHSYPQKGQYNVTLTVSDDNGCSASSMMSVTVRNVAPKAQIGHDMHLWGNVTTISFAGSGFDTYSDQPGLSYYWQFGDEGTSSQKSPTFTFPFKSWSYVVKLTITDDDGSSNETSIVVAIVLDSDGDNLTNEMEIALGTNPYNYDTDGDWLIDYYEVYTSGTDPRKADTDSDGLNDWEEINSGADGYVTDPFNPDSDYDGLMDGQEQFTKSFVASKRATISGKGNYSAILVSESTGTPESSIKEAFLSVGVSGQDVSRYSYRIASWYGFFQNYKEVWLQKEGKNPGAKYNMTSFDLADYGLLSGRFSQPYCWMLIMCQNSSVTDIGYIEAFQLTITVRTNPTDPDADGDGLLDGGSRIIDSSDSINISYFNSQNPSIIHSGNADGTITYWGEADFGTNPWKTDTDGDTIKDSDEIFGMNGHLKTDPLKWDTDGDEVSDSADIDPLHNVMIKVTLLRVHHGGDCWWSPTLQGVMQLGDRRYYSERVVATTDRKSADSDTMTTAIFNDAYYIDIPDDATSVGVYFEGWSINSGRNDDILTNFTRYYATTANDIDEFTCGSNGSTVNAKIELFKPSRINSIAVYDINATHALNGVVHYKPGNRYFVFEAYCTDYPSSGAFVHGVNTIVAPWELYLNSYLFGRLQNLSCSPFNSDTVFYGDNSSKSEITYYVPGIVAGNFTSDTLNNYILKWLLQDFNGKEIYDSVRPGNNILLMGLPIDVLRLVPYQGYTDSPQGDPPVGSIWEKIGKFIVDVANAIIGGIIAFLSFIINLITAVIEWGLKVIAAFVNAAINVIKAVVEVVAKVLKAIFDFIVSLINAAIQLVVKPILDAANAWCISIKTFIASNLIPSSESETSSLARTQVLSRISSNGTQDTTVELFDMMTTGSFPTLVWALSWALIGLEYFILCLSFAIPGGAFLSTLINTMICSALQAIIGILLDPAVVLAAIAAGTVCGYILSQSDPSWNLPVAIFGTAWTLILTLIEYAAIKKKLGGGDLGDAAGLFLCILGLVATWVGTTQTDDYAVFLLSLIGTALSLGGLVISLKSTSAVEGLHKILGHIDEGFNACTFAYSCVRTYDISKNYPFGMPIPS